MHSFLDLAGRAVSVFKDIVIADSAILTACIAWWGINSWKREVGARTRHRHAATVLLAAVRLRNEIRRMRALRGFTTMLREGQSPWPDRPTRAGDNYNQHIRRLASVEQRGDILDAKTIAASIFLGEAQLREALEPLRECAGELSKSLHQYHMLEIEDAETEEPRSPEGIQLARVLFARTEGDDFETKLSAAFAVADSRLREFLL